MLADSGLLNDLGRFAFSPAGTSMCVYGDPAYPLRIQFQAPFRQAHLTPLMEAYNTAMSTVRNFVEWIFGNIINSYMFFRFQKESHDSTQHCGHNVCCL